MELKAKYLILLTKLLLLLLLLLKTKHLLLVIQSKKIDYNAKLNKTEKKITDHDHDKYITTTQELTLTITNDKLTSENLGGRLAQANSAK